MHDILAEAELSFESAIERLGNELAGVQTGRASAALVENIYAEIYGARQPLKFVANISVPEPRTLAIQPFDRSQMAAIEKAIRDSGLGLNPNSDGARILLNIPPMTQERRRDMVKLVGQLAEDARIAVRRARQDALNTAKRKKNENEMTEDEVAILEKKVQAAVDAANDRIEEMAKKKEADVMTV